MEAGADQCTKKPKIAKDMDICLPYRLFSEMQSAYEDHLDNNVEYVIKDELTGDDRVFGQHENDCDVKTVLAKVMPFDEEKHFSKRVYDMVVQEVGKYYNLRHAAEVLAKAAEDAKYITHEDLEFVEYGFFMAHAFEQTLNKRVLALIALQD